MEVADAAQWNDPQPPELAQALNCRTWNTLPRAGGLYDQPAGLVTRMNSLLNVWDAFISRADAGNIGKWSERHPDYLRITSIVERMRINRGR